MRLFPLALTLASLLPALSHADPDRWDAQTTHQITVRHLGLVDGRPLYLEHRRGEPSGDMTAQLLLLRSDPFPSPTPFGVATAVSPAGEATHRTLDPNDSTRPLTVPGVIQVLYTGFAVPSPHAVQLSAGLLRVNDKQEVRHGTLDFNDTWKPAARTWTRVTTKKAP